MGPDVDLERVARGTPMFSGADLAAIINEADALARAGYIFEADGSTASALERLRAGVASWVGAPGALARTAADLARLTNLTVQLVGLDPLRPDAWPVAVAVVEGEHGPLHVAFGDALGGPFDYAGDNFRRCLPLLLGHERGFVNDPNDVGGATNFGVTIGTLSGWRQQQGLPVATVEDVRNLTLAEAVVLYRAEYWNKVRGDALPPGLAWAVFDAAVTSGAGARSTRGGPQVLQRGLFWAGGDVGVIDGVIGPRTLAAVAAVSERDAIIGVMGARAAGYATVRTEAYRARYLNGWMHNRVAKTMAQALVLAGA